MFWYFFNYHQNSTEYYFFAESVTMSSQQSKKRKHTEEVDDDVSGDPIDLKHKKDVEKDSDSDSDNDSEDSEEDSDYSESNGSEGKEFINEVINKSTSFVYRLMIIKLIYLNRTSKLISALILRSTTTSMESNVFCLNCGSKRRSISRS